MTQLLKTSPLEAMARRKVEQKGPSAVMTFPKNIGAHGTLMRYFKYSYGGSKGSEETRLAEIMLPLPKTIQDNFKINVGGDELGLLGSAGAQVAGDPKALGEMVSNLSGQLKKVAGDAGNVIAGAISGKVDGDQVGMAVKSTLETTGYIAKAGLAKVAPDIANGIGAGTGTAVNPFATLVFKGVDLKVHSLEWLLSPESEEESRELKKIIRTLQRMVLPETSSPIGGNETGVSAVDRGILRYPAMCNVYLMGVDQSYYFRFKTSMISQLGVDYTPNGIAIQKGGKPSAIRITMTLNEAYIHTAEDNQPSELIEEAIAERIDDRISDRLSSDDGESPTYDSNVVRTDDGSIVAQNNAVSSDEVTITKSLPGGETDTKVMTKAQLKAQGFNDAQIAGTVATGIDGVTFTPGT